MTHERILIVEDEALIAMELEDRLSRLGYVVVGAAASRDAALQRTCDTSPDLVLMDVRIQGPTDGIETAAEIRSRFDLPVVYLTAHADDETLQRAAITEPHNYLIKPFRERELHIAIEMALYKHRMERERKRADTEIQLLQTVALAVSAAETFEEALGVALRRICDVAGWAYGEVWVPDPEQMLLKCAAIWHNDSPALETFRAVSERFVFAHGEGLPGQAWESKKPIWVRDIAKEANFLRRTAALQAGLNCIICVPALADQDVIAIINFFLFRASEEDRRLMEIISTAATQLGQPFKRKQAETMLRKLSSAVEQTEDIIIITDARGIIEYVNPAFEKITGYTRQYAVGKTPRLVKSAYHDKAFYENLWRTILAGNTYRGMLVNRKADGELFYTEKAITPIKDREGRITHFVSTDRDVTLHMEAQRAIVQYAARAESMARLAARLAVQTDELSIVAAVCEEVARAIPSVSASVVLLDEQSGALHYAGGFGFPPGVEANLCAILLAEHEKFSSRAGVFTLSSADIERLSNTRRSGSPPDVRSVAVAALTRSEALIGMLSAFAIGEDRQFTEDEFNLLKGLADQAATAITKSRLYGEAEERLAMLEALREVDRAITANLDLGVALNVLLEQVTTTMKLDAASVLLFSPASQMLEYAAGRGFATDALRHSRLRLGDGYAGRAAMERRIFHIAALSESNGFQRAPNIAREGFVAYYAVPLTAKGQLKGVLEIFQRAPLTLNPQWLDFLSAVGVQAAIAISNAELVQELQDSVKALSAAQAQLAASARLTAVGELAAGVAHQINNPLTTIITDTHILLNSVERSSPSYESAHAVFQAAWRAQRVVQRLLNFARPDSGEYVPTNINATINEALELVGAHLRRGGVDVQMHLSENLPRVLASGQQLEEVWINLLINARDALIEDRPGIIMVASRLSNDGAVVEVDISDNGRGISASDSRRLFTPFFTTKEKGRGNGLGLSVCQTIIRNHGGDITFDSTPGRGTIFTARLPLARPLTESEEAIHDSAPAI